MNCPKCGNYNNEGTNFCTSCGNNLSTPMPQPTIQPITPQPIIEESNQLNQLQTNMNSEGTTTQGNITEVMNNNHNPAPDNTNNNNSTFSFNGNVVANQPSTNQELPRTQNNKKIIFIIGGIVALIAIIVVIIVCLGRRKDISSNIDLNDALSPSKPIPIEKNGKYGYLSQEGKILLEPIYNKVGEFYGDYAVVSVDNPDTTIKDKEIYQIIDKNGNNKTPVEIYSEPRYYQEYGIWVIGNEIYDSKLNKISPENLELEYLGEGYFVWRDRESGNEASGLMNIKGEITYTYHQQGDGYKYVMYDVSKNNEIFEETYCRVNISNDEYGIVNCDTGKIVYGFTENYVFVDKNNIFRIYTDDSFSNSTEAYIQNDKIVYQTSSSGSDISFNHDGYIEIEENDTTKYIDIKTGKIMTTNPNQTNENIDIDPEDLIDELTYGYRELYESGKYGLISNNKVVVQPEYDDVEFLNSTLYNYIKKEKGQELILLEKNNQTLLMNIKNKKILTAFDSTSVKDYDDSSFLKISIYEDYTIKNYLIYNILSGKSITINADDKVDIYSNYIIVENKEKKTYYNTDLTQIYQEEVLANE